MPRRSPTVVGTFAGAAELDVADAGRLGLRGPQAVVVATEPTQALLARWAARLADDPQPLARARPGGEVLTALQRHQRQRGGRRTVLWVVAPPAPLSATAVAVLERVAHLLAADPDVVPSADRGAVLDEVRARLVDEGPPPVLDPEVQEGLRREHAALEAYLESNRVVVRGDRDLLRPAAPAGEQSDPEAVLERTATIVADLVQDLRTDVRRTTGTAPDPAVVARG